MLLMVMMIITIRRKRLVILQLDTPSATAQTEEWMMHYTKGKTTALAETRPFSTGRSGRNSLTLFQEMGGNEMMKRTRMFQQQQQQQQQQQLIVHKGTDTF